MDYPTTGLASLERLLNHPLGALGTAAYACRRAPRWARQLLVAAGYLHAKRARGGSGWLWACWLSMPAMLDHWQRDRWNAASGVHPTKVAASGFEALAKYILKASTEATPTATNQLQVERWPELRCCTWCHQWVIAGEVWEEKFFCQPCTKAWEDRKRHWSGVPNGAAQVATATQAQTSKPEGTPPTNGIHPEETQNECKADAPPAKRLKAAADHQQSPSQDQIKKPPEGEEHSKTFSTVGSPQADIADVAAAPAAAKEPLRPAEPAKEAPPVNGEAAGVDVQKAMTGEAAAPDPSKSESAGERGGAAAGKWQPPWRPAIDDLDFSDKDVEAARALMSGFCLARRASSSSFSENGEGPGLTGAVLSPVARVAEQSTGLPFSDLEGGLSSLDSLKVLVLVSSLRRELGLELALNDVIQCRSFAELEKLCEQAGGNQQERKRPQTEQQPSSNGMRRYTIFAIPRFWKAPVGWLLRLDRMPTEVAMRAACLALVHRHPGLRAVPYAPGGGDALVAGYCNVGAPVLMALKKLLPLGAGKDQHCSSPWLAMPLEINAHPID